jgi:hypothetical protein
MSTIDLKMNEIKKLSIDADPHFAPSGGVERGEKREERSKWMAGERYDLSGRWQDHILSTT